MADATAADLTVSRDGLKRLTGEFDLEGSVFRLSLAGRGIRHLGALGDCAGLEFLDLSDNQLTDPGPLSGMKRLRYLNLAGNRMAGAAGLDGCEALVELNLAGNLIACTEDLQALCSLDHLESLHLQDRSRGLSNPICMSAGYAAKILTYLPGLTSLDGDPVRGGSGDDYYRLCQQVELALTGGSGLDAAARGRQSARGLGDGFWTIGDCTAAGQAASPATSAAAAAAEVAFTEAVAQVRDRELRAMLAIEGCERDLRKRKT